MRSAQIDGGWSARHLQRDVPRSRFALHEGDDVANQVLDADLGPGGVGSRQKGAYPLDDVGRAVASRDHALDGGARFAQVGWFALEPSKAGTAVRNDRGERLVDFMGDRRGQLAHGRHACDARQLALRLGDSGRAEPDHLCGRGVRRLGDSRVRQVERQHAPERVEQRAENLRLVDAAPNRRKRQHADQIIDASLETLDLAGGVHVRARQVAEVCAAPWYARRSRNSSRNRSAGM
jgi:hypothetical protein